MPAAVHEPLGVVVGLDIGGTKTHAIAFDGEFEKLADLHVPTAVGSVEWVAESALGTIAALTERLDGRPLRSIGIGLPGLVDTTSGSVRQAVNLGIGDEPLDLVDRLVARFQVPCRIDNDVNVAALGAFHLLGSDKIRDLVYLSVGTGLAAGIVLNGRLHRGRRGVAGEIGHFPVVTDGPTCECGLSGCIEVLASGPAIARQWPTEDTTQPAAALIEEAENGDPNAIETLEQIADHLARAVYLVAVTYDVDRIVIGGGVAEVGELLLHNIKKGLYRLESRSEFVRTLELTDRVFLKPAGAVGAYGAALLGALGDQA